MFRYKLAFLLGLVCSTALAETGFVITEPATFVVSESSTSPQFVITEPTPAAPDPDACDCGETCKCENCDCLFCPHKLKPKAVSVMKTLPELAPWDGPRGDGSPNAPMPVEPPQATFAEASFGPIDEPRIEETLKPPKVVIASKPPVAAPVQAPSFNLGGADITTYEVRPTSPGVVCVGTQCQVQQRQRRGLFGRRW